MTTELAMLALSVVLGIVQIVLSAQTKNLPTGYLWAAGPRDEPRPPLTAMAGRLERALSNFLETFPLFAAAVLIAHATRPPRLDDGCGARNSISGDASPICRSTRSGCSWCARSPGTWRILILLSLVI
jgi:hypothetical protein